MKVTVLEQVPEDLETTLAWNNLVLQMERPEVFFTHQWALAASRAFSDNLRPLTFLIYDSGQLCGVAAMATNRESPETAFFLTASTADYCDIVSGPKNREAVLAVVLDEIEKLKVPNLVLANVPAESQTLRLIMALAKVRHLHLHQRPAYDCCIILLGDEKQRQAVKESVVRKEREKRGLKKLAQLGPTRITHLSREQLESGLQSIFAAHISRFLATNRLSPLIRPERRIFLMELGKLLGSAGWLKVSQLEVNGQPVAWNYGFRFFGNWFWYLPTFQMQYEELSPGSCLLRLLTEEACVDPTVERLDLGLGDEAYKARFSNASHSTCYVQLSKNMPQHLATVGRYKLTAFAGKIPKLDRRVRSGRDLLHGLQSRIAKLGFGATATHALKRVKRNVMSEDEVAFFEAPQIKMSENESAALIPMSWDNIAVAAMNNTEDPQTLEYLMRGAQRLREGRARGYFLQGKGTQPSHFLWVNLCDGFHLSEIDSKLELGIPDASVIFDCWTPAAQRGHGNYVTAIRLAAANLQNQKRQAWIFSSTRNNSSLRGILKAGFVYRFSLVRSRKLWNASLSRHENNRLLES